MCNILCQINSCLTTLETRDHVAYQQYYTSVLDWIAVFFSIKDSPAVYVSTTSFLNGFGESRFMILWVMPWPPCQIFPNHAAWGDYVPNPPSVFTAMMPIWLMYSKQGHFQQLKPVHFLGYNPGQRSLPTADCLVARLCCMDDRILHYLQHAKLRGSYKYVAHIKDSFHWQCDLYFFPFPNEAGVWCQNGWVNQGTWAYCHMQHH